MIAEHLADPTGKRSNTRQILFLCVPLLVLFPLFAWFGVTLAEGKLQPIPDGCTEFFGALNLILVAWGSYNKRQETLRQSAPPSTPPTP